MSRVEAYGIGNSVGVMLPKELLVKLGVQKGDMLSAIEMPDGVRPTAADPEFEHRCRWRAA